MVFMGASQNLEKDLMGPHSVMLGIHFVLGSSLLLGPYFVVKTDLIVGGPWQDVFRSLSIFFIIFISFTLNSVHIHTNPPFGRFGMV